MGDVTTRNTPFGERTYFSFGGREFPLDTKIAEDALIESERVLSQPPKKFWDHINLRPRIQTPPVVDFGWSRLLTARKQGSRATCVAFAILAAIELRAIRRGVVLDLSEQYANGTFMQSQSRPWCDSEGFRLADGLRLLSKTGICAENYCPYVDGDCTAEGPDEAAKANARFGVSRYFLIDSFTSDAPCYPNILALDQPGSTNVAYLQSIIAQGYDIILELGWPPPNDKVRGVYDVQYDKIVKLPLLPQKGAHALVIVGYNRSGPKPYFICRNSSAFDDCDDYGRTFLSYDYVRAYALYGAVVTAISQDMPA